MKLVQLLKKFAGMAGLENQKEINDFLETNKDSLELDFPDLAVNLMNEKLMTLETAKNNDAVRKHYAGMIFSGLEEGATERAMKLIGQDKINEINKSTDSTGKRINLYLEAANETLESAKKGSKSNPEFEKQLAEEQKKLIDYQNQVKAQILDIENKHLSEVEGFAWGNKISGVKINEAYSDPEIRNLAVKKAVQKEVEKRGGVLKFNRATQSWDIVQKDNPEMKVVDGGKILDFDSIFPLALQSDKLLVETPAGGASGGTPGTPFTSPLGGGTTQQDLPTYVNKSFGSADRPVTFTK